MTVIYWLPFKVTILFGVLHIRKRH